jgi:hypothetical protein
MTARILVLPGMGDIHWVALKLRAFCESQGIEKPELWIWDIDGRKRSLEFVQRLPMATAGGYWEQALTADIRPAFFGSYMRPGADVVPGFMGFDWFLCFNGSLRWGRNLERDILPGLAADWGYELAQTREEAMLGEAFRATGRYVLLYFSGHGMFSHYPLDPRRHPDLHALVELFPAVLLHELGGSAEDRGVLPARRRRVDPPA